jgi:hypothetical protein
MTRGAKAPQLTALVFAQLREDAVKRRNLTLALFLALAAPAIAQTNAVCEDIRARIANLPEAIGTGGGPEARHYASALAEQNLELRKVRGDLRRYGCSSGSMMVIGGENADYCNQLIQSEEKMADNIRYLQDRRDELRGVGNADDMRQRLMAALDQNGCDNGDFYAPETRAYQPPPSVEEQTNRSDTFIPLGGGDAGDPRYGLPRAETLSPVSTICVRSCDGGFFPISSNATSVDFGRDAETCAKMCPGIETQLFYRSISSTDAATMISTATGTPYSAMTNAFAYKNRQPGEKSTCACNLTAYYEQMRKSQAASVTPAEAPQKGSITTIRTKPPVSAPATNTAAAAPIQATAPATIQPQVPDRPYDPSASKVRQVGPQFLAGDQGNLDLKNPAASGPQPQQQ